MATCWQHTVRRQTHIIRAHVTAIVANIRKVIRQDVTIETMDTVVRDESLGRGRARAERGVRPFTCTGRNIRNVTEGQR